MDLDQRRHMARRIVQMRKLKSWSAEWLAHEAGVSSKTISRWENAQVEDPRDGTILKIALALGVAPEALTGPRPSLEDLERESETQLDRIERKLDELIEVQVERELEESVEQDEQQGHDSEADDDGSSGTAGA